MDYNLINSRVDAVELTNEDDPLKSLQVHYTDDKGRKQQVKQEIAVCATGMTQDSKYVPFYKYAQDAQLIREQPAFKHCLSGKDELDNAPDLVPAEPFVATVASAGKPGVSKQRVCYHPDVTGDESFVKPLRFAQQFEAAREESS